MSEVFYYLQISYEFLQINVTNVVDIKPLVVRAICVAGYLYCRIGTDLLRITLKRGSSNAMHL